jgi:hypothetical protein
MNITPILLAIFISLSTTVHTMQKQTSPNNEVIWTIKDYSKKLEKEKNIILTMYGASCAGPDKVYDGKVHVIDVGYRIDKAMKFEEARKLFYAVADGLLKELNEKDSIRNCFYNYPVTYKDLYLRLSFDYGDEGYLKHDDISMIAILDNKIMYLIVEEDGGNVGIETREVVPDVHFVTGSSSKTRWITKKLPEPD